MLMRWISCCCCAIEERLKNGDGVLGDSESTSASSGLSAFASASSGPPPSAGVPSASLLANDMGSMLPSSMEDHLSHANANETAITTTTAIEDPTIHDSKGSINAIWSFEGHVLRELQPSEKNPQHNAQHANSASEGDDAVSSRETDEDGYPTMYGSCGRDKKYARCSVCYFRGLRCNSAHYCASCQRPVCIRPRTYPGEEHPKICWNVLHTDKDMVQRVEKKKRRRLQAVGMSSSMMTSGGGDGTSLKSDMRAAASAALHASRSASLAENAMDASQLPHEMTLATTPPADSGEKEVINI